MNNPEQPSNHETLTKYSALMALISTVENRLRWSDIFYLALNIIVLLFTINFTSSLFQKIGYFPTYMDLALVFICIVTGMSINAYWLAFSMRVQLRLKLRYFQARFLERKMNSIGENIFSDESVFFEPAIRRVESPDKKETVHYPTSGFSAMDGFVGSAKPRYFSWLLPCLFIFIYWIIFILVVTKI